MTRTAIVHDWLTPRAGTEMVLEAMLEAFPTSPVNALVYVPADFRDSPIRHASVRTSFMQRLPKAGSKYRSYLPLMPVAVEQFDVTEADVVISNVKAVAHGVLSTPDQFHLAYLNRTMRYAWDQYHQELKSFGVDRGVKGAIARAVYHYLRLWDFQAMQRPDVVVANSRYVARRVEKVYRRKPEVVYPPVEVEGIPLVEAKDERYVTVTRLVPYKRVDVVVRAFNELGAPIDVIGDGPLEAKLRAMARPNIRFHGWLPREELLLHVRRARAMVYTAEEEFGIAPVEAQAAGTPVIAYGGGALPETVLPGETGILFAEQSPRDLVNAVKEFESGAHPFAPERLREHAERFSAARFRSELSELIDRGLGQVRLPAGDTSLP